MLVSNVLLLLVLTIFDGQTRGAPIEHRLEDVLIFDRDPDQPSKTVELADPTKPIEIPSISRDDAEVILKGLGYNESEPDDFGVSKRFNFGQDLSFEEMVRNFQRSVGLEETGQLNDETKVTMAAPHCGITSAEKRGGVARWTKRLISYRIRDYPAGASSSFVRSMMKRAFNEWSKVTNLDFVESNDRSADIEVNFGGDSHNRRDRRCTFQSSLTMAHAYPPEDGDVHFNSQYFFENSKYREDFLDTAMHEIGHSLGLAHSDEKGALMYRSSLSRFMEPQPDDVRRIQELYGSRRGGRALGNTAAPRFCTVTKYDAVVDDSTGRWAVLAGKYYYDSDVNNPTGKLISSRWPGLPGNIDAAFRYPDGRVYFFKGDRFWRYRGNRLDAGYPRRISEGFPGLPNNIDGAFVDSRNKIFALKQNKYWVYNSNEDTTPSFALSSLGLPRNVDAAVGTGKSFVVFRGRNFYRFQNGKFKEFRNKWMECR
ncbi:72 kDa type IV collagenase-like [Aedes albopictus]|uniref:Peptidase metallopeptidase domain-containing protein n=1 Tax=Aedes albopictus TaxID=7160 RepID=A0ABM1Y6S2_AEDAL